MGHRFFGKGRKLQYLVRWKGYSAADDTWETVDQVFAPQLLEAYHRKHLKGQPFPHKRGAINQGKLIRSLFSLCQTTPAMPLMNRRPLPTSTFRSPLPCLKSLLTWTQTSSTMSPHHHQAPRRHLWSPGSISGGDASPPSPPLPSPSQAFGTRRKRLGTTSGRLLPADYHHRTLFQRMQAYEATI